MPDRSGEGRVREIQRKPQDRQVLRRDEFSNVDIAARAAARTSVSIRAFDNKIPPAAIAPSRRRK